MVPALKQDWIDVEPNVPPIQLAYTDSFDYAFSSHTTTGPIQVHFTSSHLFTLMVEMRMDSGHAFGEAVYGFEGSTEHTQTAISPNQEFHPIRSEAAS
jgi:hypothetical protein